MSVELPNSARSTCGGAKDARARLRRVVMKKTKHVVHDSVHSVVYIMAVCSIFPLRCGPWEPRDHCENRIDLVFELFSESRRHGTGR
jgi:hypothetical protein